MQLTVALAALLETLAKNTGLIDAITGAVRQKFIPTAKEVQGSVMEPIIQLRQAQARGEPISDTALQDLAERCTAMGGCFECNVNEMEELVGQFHHVGDEIRGIMKEIGEPNTWEPIPMDGAPGLPVGPHHDATKVEPGDNDVTGLKTDETQVELDFAAQYAGADPQPEKLLEKPVTGDEPNQPKKKASAK